MCWSKSIFQFLAPAHRSYIRRALQAGISLMQFFVCISTFPLSFSVVFLITYSSTTGQNNPCLKLSAGDKNSVLRLLRIFKR